METQSIIPANRTITCSAPAKINWFLNLTAQRADGYHELQSALQFLDLHDTLELTLREDSRIERRGSPLGVSCSGDLILRAAQALQSQTESPLGASITLTKRIPMGAGLGGGSSDAATTLVGLNYLWDTRLTPKDLAGLGLTLGADVPVFVYARATGSQSLPAMTNTCSASRSSQRSVKTPPSEALSNWTRRGAGIVLTHELCVKRGS